MSDKKSELNISLVSLFISAIALLLSYQAFQHSRHQDMQDNWVESIERYQASTELIFELQVVRHKAYRAFYANRLLLFDLNESDWRRSTVERVEFELDGVQEQRDILELHDELEEAMLNVELGKLALLDGSIKSAISRMNRAIEHAAEQREIIEQRIEDESEKESAGNGVVDDVVE